jgi:hypothetical protein
VREYHLVVASLLPAFNLLAEVMHELRVSDRLWCGGFSCVCIEVMRIDKLPIYFNSLLWLVRSSISSSFFHLLGLHPGLHVILLHQELLIIDCSLDLTLSYCSISRLWSNLAFSPALNHHWCEYCIAFCPKSSVSWSIVCTYKPCFSYVICCLRDYVLKLLIYYNWRSFPCCSIYPQLLILPYHLVNIQILRLGILDILYVNWLV